MRNQFVVEFIFEQIFNDININEITHLHFRSTPIQISPISPNLSRQASGVNILARTSSSGSNSSGSPHPSLGSANSQRQSSQGSLFEQFATQTKELIRETKRQSSQDGLLAHVDKVILVQNQRYCSIKILYTNWCCAYNICFFFYFLLRLKIRLLGIKFAIFPISHINCIL